MEVKVEKNYGYIIGEMNGDINSEIKDDFENMKKNCKDDKTTQKLDEGIKACNEKNKNKVAEVLKWLGDNAMDFVKTFASDALKQIIFN